MTCVIYYESQCELSAQNTDSCYTIVEFVTIFKMYLLPSIYDKGDPMRRIILIIGVLVAILSFSIVVQAQDDSSPIVHTVAAGENLYRISLQL